MLVFLGTIFFWGQASISLRCTINFFLGTGQYLPAMYYRDTGKDQTKPITLKKKDLPGLNLDITYIFLIKYGLKVLYISMIP